MARRTAPKRTDGLRYSTGCRTGKRGYASKADAKYAKRQAVGTGSEGAPGLSPYRCHEADCDMWHLGHLHADTKRGGVT